MDWECEISWKHNQLCRSIKAIFLYYLFLSLVSKKVELLMKKSDYPVIILDNGAFKNKFICFSAEIKIVEQKVNLIFL